MKGMLNCCQLQGKLVNVFQYKYCLPFDLVRLVMKVRSGANIGISSLTLRKVKLLKESAICDLLLICYNIPSFDEFAILAYGHHKYILIIKENLFIKFVLKKNISSAKLGFFDN